MQNHRAERRDEKRRKKKYGMKVSGKGVKLIQKIKQERAKKIIGKRK
ncbi:hypothetical protein KJ855_00230 [Patescibacteria group bacterium]|nr:hypothetical protein [Patescibacteria group bacterium]